MIHDIELSLIGACVLTGSIEDTYLRDSDFHCEDHQRIWAAITSLAPDPIDLITVCDKLADDRLAAIVSEATSQAAPGSSIPAYAKRVKDGSTKRRLHHVCHEIIHLDDISAAELIAKAQGMIESLEAPQREKDEYKSFVQYLESQPTDLKGGYFDSHTGGIEHGLWVLAAGTGVGKTTFALNLAKNLLNQAPVTYYSYEMGTDQIMAKMVCAYGSIAHNVMRDRMLDDLDWEKVLKAVTWYKNKGLKVVDKTLDIDSLCAHIRQSKRKRGIRAAFVDYLQLVPSYGDSRVLEVANISRKLKQVSLELEIPIFALSQLSRKHEERSNPRPRNSDLRESGSVEQDADVVLFLYDEAKLMPDSPRKGLTELYAGKNRHGELFSVALRQELNFCRFTAYEGHMPDSRKNNKPDFRE